MNADFTARNVAKWVARSLVAMKTTELAASAVADYTRFEKDDLVVKIGAGVIGWGVGAKLEPVTDAIVDKTADFVAEQREKYRSRKDNQQD